MDFLANRRQNLRFRCENFEYYQAMLYLENEDRQVDIAYRFDVDVHSDQLDHLHVWYWEIVLKNVYGVRVPISARVRA